MTRARVVWMGLAALSALVGVAFELGRRQERVAQLSHAQAAVVETLRVVDTVYARDTLRFVRWRTRWDTVAQTVEHWKHDTVRVVEVVRVADSTVRACAQALATCQRRADLLLRRAVLAESLLAIPPTPPRTMRWQDRALGFGVGLAGGVLLTR